MQTARHFRDLTLAEKLRLRIAGFEHAPLPGSLRRIAARRLPDPYAREGALDNGKRVIFIHVPKTAGTSLAKALDIPSGHIPVSRYIARDEQRFRRAYSFAFVRNPWDRLFSAYNYLHSAIGINASPDVRWAEANLGQYPDFESFVLALKTRAFRSRILRWKHFRAQADWLVVPGAQEVEVDFLGRYEAIEADTKALESALGKAIDVPHLRQAHSYGERAQFTPEMAAIIGEIYSRDARLLGYDGPPAATGPAHASDGKPDEKR